MKIFEAMAMGKPIVSTTIGAEGLPVSNEETIVIEDNPVKTTEKIIELFGHRDQGKRIGNNALEIVRENFLKKIFSY